MVVSLFLFLVLLCAVYNVLCGCILLGAVYDGLCMTSSVVISCMILTLSVLCMTFSLVVSFFWGGGVVLWFDVYEIIYACILVPFYDGLYDGCIWRLLWSNIVW